VLAIRSLRDAPGRSLLTAALVTISSFAVSVAGALTGGMEDAVAQVLQSGGRLSSWVCLVLPARCPACEAGNLADIGDEWRADRDSRGLTLQSRVWTSVVALGIDGKRIVPRRLAVVRVQDDFPVQAVRWLVACATAASGT